MVGQGISGLGLIVGVRFLTSLLSPSEYGVVALGLTVSLFVNQILSGPVSQAVLRSYSIASESRTLGSFFSVVNDLVKWMSSPLMALAVILYIFSVVLPWGNGQSVALAFVLAATTGAEAAFDSVQNAARRRKIVAFHQAARAWFRFAVAILCVATLGATGEVALLGYVVGTGAVLASQYMFFRSMSGVEDARSAETKREILSSVAKYARPFAIWGVFTWLQLASDRWSLQLTDGAASVGKYSALYQVAYLPLVLASNALVQFISPIVFQRAGDASDKSRLREARGLGRRAVLVVVLGTVVLSLCVWLADDFLARLLLAESYRGVAWLFPIVALAGGLYAAGQVATQIPLAALSSGDLLAPKLGTAVFGSILNIIGAWFFGIVGVVFAITATSIVYLAWTLTLGLERSFGEPDPA